VRHRWDDIFEWHAEPDERLPELSAGCEHDGMEQHRERNDLRLGRSVQRWELRLGLLRRRDGLRVGHAEPDERLPELSAGCEHDGMEQHRERNDLRLGRGL
jgi:hypothetical protein